MPGRTGSTGGSRRSTAAIPTWTRRTSSPAIPPTSMRERPGVTRARSTGRRSRSSPRPSRSSPARPRPRPPGSSRCSRRAECSRASCSLHASRATGRTRRRSSAGTRSSRSTSPAVGTTTRFSSRLTLAAIALAAVGRRGLAGAAWAVAILLKWIPLVFFALRAIAARKEGRRVGHAGFAAAALVVLALATWRYGFDWVRAVGPLSENAEEQSSYALPHRLEQLGVPHGLTFAAAVAALVSRARVARPRSLARQRPAGARGLPPARDHALADAVVRDLGAAVRGGGGRSPRAADRARLLRVPAASDDPGLARDGRRGCRPRRRRGATGGRRAARPARAVPVPGRRLSRNVRRRSSTTTHSASASTGKLKMRRRSERCAPRAFVALTGAPSGTSSSARRCAAARSSAVRSTRPRGPSSEHPGGRGGDGGDRRAAGQGVPLRRPTPQGAPGSRPRRSASSPRSASRSTRAR